MDAPSGIGERIARHRAHRGLTQEALAHSAGVSIDVVRRLEQGTRRTARLSTLASLARALDCDVATLLRPDASEPPRGDGIGLYGIRRVLTAPGVLPGFADFCDDTADTPDLAALRASAAHVWRLYQDGGYDAVSRLLPDLITDARNAARELAAADQAAAFGMLATACQASAGVAITLGQEDLAFIAVERAVSAAEQCGDPLHQASAANFLSWIYRRHGRLAEAEEVAVRAAEQCEPAWLSSSPEQVSVFGGLLLNAAGAAARAGRAQRSRDLSATARAAAARAGRDRVDQWVVFGPSVAAMNEVNNAVEYGDLDEARHLADVVPVQKAGVPATWSARYLLNVAQVQVEQRRAADAHATLQQVRALAPEWIRYHPQARTLVIHLLDRKGRPPKGLRELASHLQI